MKILRKIVGILLALTVIYLVNHLAVAEEEFKPTMDFKKSRLAAGYLDSGSDGNYQAGSYQMPYTLLQFNWLINPDTTVYAKMILNNAKFNGFCCLFVELQNLATHISPSLKDSLFNPTVSVGQFKMRFGEELPYNEPILGLLASNSAGAISGMDEGLNLCQEWSKEKFGIPFRWSLSLHNGNSTAPAVDNTQSKAVVLNLSALPLPALYVSGSYYNSGELGLQDAALTYAGLATRPTNATEWSRNIWEFDLRYDIQPGKKDNSPAKIVSKSSCCGATPNNSIWPGVPAFSSSKAFFRAAYGKFDDSGKDKVLPILSVTDRKGAYYYVEGCYNATEKLYLGSRYSVIGFDKSTTFASLNGVNANEYTRISFGPGYRLISNTHIKAEYSIDSEDVPTGVSKPRNNQVAVLVTTLF